MPDLRGLLADPEFKALPLERRTAILSRVNPQLAQDYAASHASEDAPQAQPAAPGRNTSPSTIGPLPWYQQGLVGGVSVQDALNAIPIVGGAVGGMLGGAGGTAFGAGVGGVPGAVAGAAIGGAGGEAFNQLGRRALGIGGVPSTPAEAAQRIGVQGAVQGGAEGLGRGVIGGVRRVAAPFAGRVNAPVAAAAARQGVEMPAAALSDSMVVPTVEAVAAKGVGGGQAAQRYTNAAATIGGKLDEMAEAATRAAPDLTDMAGTVAASARKAGPPSGLTVIADHVAKVASRNQDQSMVGRTIAKGMDTFRTAWMKQKNALYEAAALPDKGLKVQAKQTVDLLDAIIEGKRDAGGILRSGPVADASFYRGLRDGLTKTVEEGKWVGEEFVKTSRRVVRPVEASKLLQAMKELRTKVSASFADPFAAANKGTIKKLSATMDGEFRAALEAADPGLAAKLRAADAVYKEGLGKINSAFGTNVHKLAKAGHYDKIALAVANPRTSVDDLPKIMELAGVEGTEAMRAAVLADIVAKSKNAGGQVTPEGLTKAIRSFGEDRLEALLRFDQMARLKNLGSTGQAGMATARAEAVSDVVTRAGGKAGQVTAQRMSETLRAVTDDLGQFRPALEGLSESGSAGQAAQRAEIMADVVKRAKGPGGILTPQGINFAIKKVGEPKLRAILGPYDFAKLKDLGMLSGSLERGRKVMDGSQTAYLLSHMNYVAAFYHVMGSPARKFLASKAGQRWLTGGYKPWTGDATAAVRSVTLPAHTAAGILASEGGDEATEPR